MVDAMATGASGIEEEENEDGFWTKCIVTTKHYTDYAGKQFRRSAIKRLDRRSFATRPESGFQPENKPIPVPSYRPNTRRKNPF